MPRLAIALLLVSSVAAAEPTTAADVANAPLPDQASGRVDPVDNGDTTAREVARDALLVPRWTLDTLLTPVRTIIWAHNRYDLGHADGGAVPQPRSISVDPAFAFQSGFGITGAIAGAHVTVHDLAGAREDVSLLAAAGAGYYFRQLYAARVDSGRRFGEHFRLALDGGYEQRPRDAFYGIGDVVAPAMRYDQDRARGGVTGDVALWHDLHLRPAAAMTWSSVGSQTAAAGVALRWDNRRSWGEWDPVHTPTGGTFAEVSAARAHELGSMGTDYWRYGADVQQLIRLAVGPRVLSLRLHGEGITAGSAAVPFVELPALGGPLFLRGYALDQFRDRVAAMGSLEYRWDLARWIEAHAFVDAGRVYDSLDALTLHGMRVGYGIGLDFGHGTSIIDVGSSSDGGMFVMASFNPILDLEQNARSR
jgi:hypothetical protein